MGDLNRRSCSEVPVQDCQQKARRVCSLVPSIETKEVSDRQCTTSQRSVCQPISKQVCNDVNEPRQVCNDLPEEVCDNVAASVTKYVDDEQCSNVGARNVLLPPDKSVPMLLNRFQDRPTRLNVRLNTLKSVASLAVVMEIKLFELFLH